MTQNGGTRGGIFNGIVDRSRERQGWTITGCTNMPERYGRIKERIAQSKQARAGLLAIVD